MAGPRGFLARFPDGAVLDEVQRCPELFSWLQGVVDADGRVGLFVLTGSQQFGLLSGVTQSLAGRAGRVQLLPFSLSEIASAGLAPESLDELLFNGLYPPIYDRHVAPVHWYADYIFGFNKVRYRGLDKNANRLFVACGLVNLYMARRQLLRPT